MSQEMLDRYNELCRTLKIDDPSPLSLDLAQQLRHALTAQPRLRLAGCQVIAGCGGGEARARVWSSKALRQAAPAGQDFLRFSQQAAAAVAACWPASSSPIRLACEDAPRLAMPRIISRGEPVAVEPTARSAWGRAELPRWFASRYSRTAKLPYRKLKDKGVLILGLACDAADYSSDGGTEEAAATAVNLAGELGLPISERRTVLDWCSALRLWRDQAASSAEIDQHTLQLWLAAPIGPESISESDGRPDWTGLPISMCLHHAEKNGTISSDDIRELCWVDPDAQIDLGDLLTWMVRERALGKRLQAEAQP